MAAAAKTQRTGVVVAMAEMANTPATPSRKARSLDEIRARIGTPDAPAAKAGLQEGDIIVKAGGQPIRDVGQLIEATAPRAGQPTEYVVERAGQELPPIMITPADRGGRGQIGVSAKMTRLYQDLGVWDSAKLSIALPWQMTVMQLEGLTDMVKRRSTEGKIGRASCRERV